MFQWIFCIRPSSGSKQQHLDVENSACVTKEKVNKSFNMLTGGGCARKWSIDPKHQNIMVGVKLEQSIIILLNWQRFSPLHHHGDARGYTP